MSLVVSGRQDLVGWLNRLCDSEAFKSHGMNRCDAGIYGSVRRSIFQWKIVCE